MGARGADVDADGLYPQDLGRRQHLTIAAAEIHQADWCGIGILNPHKVAQPEQRFEALHALGEGIGAFGGVGGLELGDLRPEGPWTWT